MKRIKIKLLSPILSIFLFSQTIAVEQVNENGAEGKLILQQILRLKHLTVIQVNSM